MRLESISIQNFKILEEQSITNPTALNVFVGKNNSGKSNILKAIDLFFQFFSTDTISKQLRQLNSQLDFFDRDTDRKIQICCELSLGEQTSTVIRALSESAPQFSKLFEQNPNNASLSITLTSVYEEGEIFTYLASIYLSDAKTYELISIDDAAGYELLKRTQYLNTLETDKAGLQKFLDRFDSDDWAMMRRDSKGAPNSRPQRPSLGRFLARFFDDIRPDTMANVERILQASDSYSSFREEISKFIDSIDEEKTNTNEQETENAITTFSGKQYQIPNLYWDIVKIVRHINILHLKDRREPIGQTEAEKL